MINQGLPLTFCLMKKWKNATSVKSGGTGGREPGRIEGGRGTGGGRGKGGKREF